MRSPNVSVTPINMEQHYSPAAAATTNGMHEPVAATEPREPPDSGSDAEVAQIDFQSTVHLRNKKNQSDGREREEIPRPMSWEGELSDGGNDDMCVDDESTSHGLPENLSVSQKPLVRNFARSRLHDYCCYFFGRL